MYKILWDFEIQTDNLISARRLDLGIVKKKKKEKEENLPNSGLCRPGWPKGEIERKGKDKYEDLARRLKTLEHESDGGASCNWCSWRSYQRIEKGLEGLEIKGRVATI